MPCRMENHVIFARKQDTVRENVGSSRSGRRRIPTGNLEETLETTGIIQHAPQYHVLIAAKKDIFLENVGVNGGNRGGERMADKAADRWRKWHAHWRRFRKF